MVKATVINLIADTPEAHGVFETYAPTSTTVFATVKSIGMSEFYKAAEAGITPTITFVLRHYQDYSGEKTVEYDGNRYRVVRTFVSGDTIEIVCEEATYNA